MNDYDLFQTTLIAFGPFDGRADRVFRQENVVWSGFGSATWHIGDTLRLKFWIESMRASSSRPGWGIVILPCELVNQDEVIVMTAEHQLMVPRRP